MSPEKSDSISVTSGLSRRTVLRHSLVGGAAVGTLATSVSGDDTDNDVSSYQPPTDVGEAGSVVSEFQDDATAVLFKRCNPWETPANEIVLDELGIEYDLVALDADLETADEVVPLEPELDMVILPSTQDQTFYDIMSQDLRQDILEYVFAGGTLVAHMATNGWPCTGEFPHPFLPNEITTEGDFIEEIGVNDGDHPIVDGLTDADLSGWGASAHGHFTNLDTDEVNVIFGAREGPEAAPVCIEYPFGDGSVIATVQTAEWPFGRDAGTEALLFNELSYAVGADAPEPPEETGLVLNDLSVESIIPGEAAQGEQIEIAATAVNRTESDITGSIDVDFDNEVIGSIDIDLDPDASVDIFAEVDVGTIVNSGNIEIGFQVAEIDEATIEIESFDSSLTNSTEEVESNDGAPLPSKLQDDATVLLLKDQDPWGEPGNEIILSELGVPYARVNSTDFDRVMDDLEAFDVVLMPSVQGQPFVDRVIQYSSRIREYVSNGGTFVGHMALLTGAQWPQFLPDGVDTVPENISEVTIVDQETPIFDGLTDDDLSRWNYSTHGFFTDVESEDILAGRADGPNNTPTYLEYQHGDGLVITTKHTVEWPFASGNGTPRLLLEELAYAVAAGDAPGVGGGDEVSTDLLVTELGDVDHSQSIGPGDAVKTLQYINGGQEAVAGQFNPAAADLTQNESVTQADVALIQDRIVGNEVEIPQRDAETETAGTR